MDHRCSKKRYYFTKNTEIGAVYLSNLKHKSYKELRNLILSGSLGPGQFLSERSLVERLGMSRTPIRAALERLEVEGFVKQSPNQGIIVEAFSITKAIEVYDLRMALESHYVRKLANRSLTADEILVLERNLEEQKLLMEENNQELFTIKDYEFHMKLAEFYGNKEIVQTMENIYDKCNMIALNVLRKDLGRIKVAYNDHSIIYKHILSGEPEIAVEKTVQHLEFGKQILIG